MTEEHWKWIDGFEGYYMISDCGRVKSFRQDKNGRIMSIKNSTGRYLIANLYKESKDSMVTKRIHNLVATAFIGKVPSGYEVHHKDGNKQNNHVSNLEIVSRKDHHIKTMAQIPDLCDGMNHYNKYERPRRLRQYTTDGQFIAEYVNGTIASHYTGICHRNILQVAAHTEYKPGKIRNQAGGYVWIFADEDNQKCN